LAFPGAAFAASARFKAHRFFVAAMILFMPSSLIRRFECFTGGVFAVREDACKLTASLARVTAAFAS